MVEERRLGHLQSLVRELARRGLVARVVRSRSGPSYCRVVNPGSGGMSENVMCAPAPGDPSRCPWSYWWSWGEPLHDVADPDGAAAKIARVLATYDGLQTRAGGGDVPPGRDGAVEDPVRRPRSPVPSTGAETGRAPRRPASSGAD